MTPRAKRIAAAASTAIALVALSQYVHFERAFRVGRLKPIPVLRGSSLALCYGDFDGDGTDEEVQLFESGRGVLATSRPNRELLWEFRGTLRFSGIGFLPRWGDVPPRVWLRSESPDSLFILFLDAATRVPADTICLQALRFGPGDPFHPKYEAFDGSAVPIGYVGLPDGGVALALEFRCGRNLMPRGFGAWDLAKETFAWRVPLGPTPSRSDHLLRHTRKRPEGLWVFGTIAPCNGAVGSGIPDTEFGAAAVSSRGELVWWRTFGEGFGSTQADVVRTGSADSLAVLAAVFGQAIGEVQMRLFRLDIDTGDVRDSVSLPAGPTGLLAADVNGDGADEAIVTYDDGAVEVRRAGPGMPVISRAQYGPGAEIRLATDLNQDGRLDVVVADTSGIHVVDARLKQEAHTRYPDGMAQPPFPRLVRLSARELGIVIPEKTGPIYRFERRFELTPRGMYLMSSAVVAAGLPWAITLVGGWITTRARRRPRMGEPLRSFPTLVGHFRVTGRLGAGGRGVVYLATDTYTGRVVALKFIRTDLEEGVTVEVALRLRREAQILTRMCHPNIPTVYEHSTSDGLDYIAMEYISGQTLARRIKEGPLSVAETIRRGRDLASALEAAHGNGIIHRDMKPGNVMISSAGETKLLDFGLGWMSVGTTSALGSLTELTRGAFRGGTFRYVSPELALGEEIDHRADLYGLGMILFEALTGEHPYPSNSPAESVYAAAHRPPPRPSLINSGIPPRLEVIVLRCLAKDPRDRYESAGALLGALEGAEL